MSVIKDVLRQSSIKSLEGLLILFVGLTCGCQNKMQTIKTVTRAESKVDLAKVSFPKVILRFESDLDKKSTLAEVNFDFYGKDLKHLDIESQKTEIRNLILIHFANSDFKKLPKLNSKIQDPKLSVYLNQFLSKSQIEQTEYQLVRVY